MSTLLRFHKFMQLVSDYMSSPPIRDPLGQRLIEFLKPDENRQESVTFKYADRSKGLFIGQIVIKDRGTCSGLVTHLELTNEALVVQMYVESDVSHFFTVPFGDLILFRKMKRRETAPFVLKPVTELRPSHHNVNPIPGGNSDGRHSAATTNGPPSARL